MNCWSSTGQRRGGTHKTPSLPCFAGRESVFSKGVDPCRLPKLQWVMATFMHTVNTYLFSELLLFLRNEDTKLADRHTEGEVWKELEGEAGHCIWV